MMLPKSLHNKLVSNIKHYMVAMVRSYSNALIYLLRSKVYYYAFIDAFLHIRMPLRM